MDGRKPRKKENRSYVAVVKVEFRGDPEAVLQQLSPLRESVFLQHFQSFRPSSPNKHSISYSMV